MIPDMNVIEPLYTVLRHSNISHQSTIFEIKDIS